MHSPELHSAGATVRNISPFSSLPAHKNSAELSTEFIHKWVIPFYMKIGHYTDFKWVEDIEAIKGEITADICLSLLGDFNWRTRLVGSYFTAVKGYQNFIDIIGNHLLKSEVCCVGHIYALTLAYFGTEKSIQYMEKYLGYYLTTPELYFDQSNVMTAILYLDRAKGTENFKKHLKGWRILEKKRVIIEEQSAIITAKFIEEQMGKIAAEDYLQSFSNRENKEPEEFSTEHFEEQISILHDLGR